MSPQQDIGTLLFGEKPAISERKANQRLGIFVECPRCGQMVVGSQMMYHFRIYHADDKSWEQEYYTR